MKTKKTKASVLVVSLIVMSIVLIASLSIALTAVQERKASIGASRTGAVFQSADKVVEQTMKEIQWGNHKLVSELSLSGFNCSDGALVSDGYKIEFLDNNKEGIDCDSETSLGEIAKFKVSATTTQVGRAIEANVDCNIKTCQQLQNIGTLGLTEGYYCLAKDIIDCSSIPNFIPIANFSGVFDGKGAMITGLKITSAGENVGLFSSLENATVENLEIQDASIEITGSSVAGILSGSAQGTSIISNCYMSGTSGKVKSSSGYIGGLIGEISDSDVMVKGCYSEADVEGSDGAGGLVGSNNGSIFNSFAVGDVSTDAGSSGGIVGFNDSDGMISSAYFGGKIDTGSNLGGIVGKNSGGSSAVENSYYNTDKNNSITIPTCGIVGDSCDSDAGKSQSDMLKEDTYNNWNFDDMWQINEGNSYPCFQWQGGVDQCPKP